MADEKKSIALEELNGERGSEGYIGRELAIRGLNEQGLPERLSLNPRELSYYSVRKDRLIALAQLLFGDKNNTAFVLFPYGVEGTGGRVIGLEQYLGPGSGGMCRRDFFEHLETVPDQEKVVIALSQSLEPLGGDGGVKETRASNVEEAVGEINGAAHVYVDKLTALLHRYGARSIEDLEKIPRALVAPEKLGIGKMQDPLERIMEILREDHVPVLYTAHSIRQASKRFQSSSLKPDQNDLNHAMAVMLYTMIDLEALIKAHPGDEGFDFTLEDMLKIAFAAYSHDIGLWVKPKGVNGSEAVKNHPSWGAQLYNLLRGKDEGFRLLGDERYQTLILGHHAGINGVSKYPDNGGEIVFHPASVGKLDLGDKLALPRQLLFTYEFLLSKAGGWLREQRSLDEIDEKVKERGWKSGRDYLGFSGMNSLKLGLGDENLLQPFVLRRVITTTGIYPAGSDVRMEQKPSDNPRHTSKFKFNGFQGRVQADGTIMLTYDDKGNDLYFKGPVDLRKGLREQVDLTLLRI